MYTTGKAQLQTIKTPAILNATPKARKTSCKVQAQQKEVERRQAILSGLATAFTLSQIQNPSLAKYGDAANVFGKITNKSGYVPYVGDGYSLLIPARWNPSKEREYRNIDVRYADNYDDNNNFSVIKEKTDKGSITEFGAAEDYVKNLGYLFGKTTFKGETQAEGGFKPNQVAAASLLNADSVQDKNGRTYYKYEFLVRTADGNEGGTHILISATVNNGTRYILRIQSGDKRWVRGYRKEIVAAFDSFTVA